MAENKEEIKNAKIESRNKLTKIISTLKYVFLLEHLVGIYRFSFNDGQLLDPNWKRKIYALCLIMWYIIIYIIFLDLQALVDEKDSYINVLDEIPCLIIMFQYVTTLITTNAFLFKANSEIFTTFADLDSQLITASSDIIYGTAKTKTNKFLLLLVVSHVVISVTDFLADDDLATSIYIYLPLCLVQKLEIVVFCLVIEMLKTRLDTINGYIKKFIDEKESDKTSVFIVDTGKESTEVINIIGCPSEDNMKIHDLAIMYDTIGYICSMVNSVFNFQIFMTLVSTFTYIVITIWTSLYYYQTPENNAGPLISISIWSLATLLTVVVMCFVCERLRLSRNNTRLLVNQLIMDYKLPKIMRMQAKAFMELIEAWPLCIMVYDMFLVDITLILKFISVSTTYLIVIVQITHFI